MFINMVSVIMYILSPTKTCSNQWELHTWKFKKFSCKIVFLYSTIFFSILQSWSDGNQLIATIGAFEQWSNDLEEVYIDYWELERLLL
jgi:hypothetical protein